jgi:geranylgeranyl pyrophosphate synthase
VIRLSLHYLTSEKKAVDKELQRYFRSLQKRESSEIFIDFIDEYKRFVLNENAKRLHPLLLIAAFNGIINPMYLEEQINDIRKVSLAVELLHNAHLIQDDLIDDDKYRRGELTFHRQFKKDLTQFYEDGDGEHSQTYAQYGKDMSVLGGTYSYLLGLDIIKESGFPEKLKLMAVQEYSEAINYLLKGQIIEEYMTNHNLVMSLEQYLSVEEMMRARVFEKSVKIGAIMAKGNVHYQIKPLSDAMLRIGQAYAIRDDILDIEKDIKGKKKKIIYILAIQNTNEEQSRKLKEIFGKDKILEKDVEEAKEIFNQTKAIKIAEHLSKNLISQAKNYLQDIYPDLNKEQKKFFTQFADYVYDREI